MISLARRRGPNGGNCGITARSYRFSRRLLGPLCRNSAILFLRNGRLVEKNCCGRLITRRCFPASGSRTRVILVLSQVLSGRAIAILCLLAASLGLFCAPSLRHRRAVRGSFVLQGTGPGLQSRYYASPISKEKRQAERIICCRCLIPGAVDGIGLFRPPVAARSIKGIVD